MIPSMIVRLNLQYKRLEFSVQDEVSDADLAAINGLKVNGPIKTLTKEDVFVRRYFILGTEPTSYMSIHPEGELNGKTLSTLSELAKTLPGCPMMEAHDTNRLPWGRIFSAEVLKGQPGYAGPVLQVSYFFLNNQAGKERAANIDAGIHSEGSISYSNKAAHCSICHKEMMVGSFMGMFFTSSKCLHKIGESYDGQTCYWYPSGLTAREVSSVYAGAYRKTKSRLALCYADDEEKAGVELLEAVLIDHNLDAAPVAAVTPEVPSGQSEPAVSILSATGAPAPASEPEQHDVLPNDGTGIQGPGSDVTYSAALSEPAKPVQPAAEIIPPVVLETPVIIQNDGTGSSTGQELAPKKYWVCVCGYWQDPNPDKKLGEARCPKCYETLQGCDEKPLPRTKKKYMVCECGHSVETSLLESGEAAAEIISNDCVECGAVMTESDSLPFVLSDDVSKLLEESYGILETTEKTIEELSASVGSVQVEPLYNGYACELHKKCGVVKITDSVGADVSAHFTGIIEEAQALKQDNFILIGDLVKYRGGKRGVAADVSTHLSCAVDDDTHFRMKVSDILIHAGIDVRSLSLQDRRLLLESFPNTSRINKTKRNTVTGPVSIARTIKALSTRDGVLVKSLAAVYGKECFKYNANMPAPAVVVEPAAPMLSSVVVPEKKYTVNSFSKTTEYRFEDLVFSFAKPPANFIGGHKVQCSMSTSIAAPGKQIDSGTFELVSRKDGFVEVIMNGKENSGRRLFRELPIVQAGRKVWVSWKPQNQEKKAPCKELCFKYQYGALLLWEGENDDTEMIG